MAKKYTYNENIQGWYTLVYDGTLNPDGSKHRKKIVSKKSSADLEKKVAAFKQSLDVDTVPSNISFGEYASNWLTIYKSTKEKNTQFMYANAVKKMQPIAGIPITSVHHSHLQQIINLNIEHPKTCRIIRQTFLQIIKSATRDRILPHSAVAEFSEDISLPKYIKPQKRPLTALEKDAVFNANLDDRKRAFVTILYYCGLRRGEALALAVRDFNWENNTITISKVVIFTGNTPEIKPYPKSDNGIRQIPLPEAAVSILKPYVAKCTDYIFHGQESPLMTQQAYKRMWESIISEMNIACGYNPQQKKDKPDKPIQGLTAHTFRHNYCTQLCYQIPVISTKMIARLMGDTEQVVLKIYSHILEEKEDLNKALNDAFSVT